MKKKRIPFEYDETEEDEEDLQLSQGQIDSDVLVVQINYFTEKQTHFELADLVVFFPHHCLFGLEAIVGLLRLLPSSLSIWP
jgi:hypothetical protein